MPAALAAQRVALGLAVGARAHECAEVARVRLASGLEPGQPPPSAAYWEQRWDRTVLATLIVARWLVVGKGATPEEMDWISQAGLQAASEGLPIAFTSRDCLCWRDALLRIIDEEAQRLQASHQLHRLAVETVAHSCDAALMHIARTYDRQLRRLARAQERQAAELASSEARFRSLYQAMASGVLVVSPDGKVLHFNDAALAMLGVDAESLRGADACGLAGLEDESGRPLEESPPAEALRLRSPVRGRIVKLKGRTRRQDRWLQCEAVPVLDPRGELVEVVTTFVDVTGFKRAEEARQESEAKSRFLATMSHELRTPLNSILGFSQLLRIRASGGLDETQLSYLAHIESSGRHLLALINDLLDLTKVDAGRMDLHCEDIELRPLLLEVTGELEPQVQDKSLHLEVSCPRALRVRVDPLRCRQVLTNLLSNAVKFTPQGWVRVSAVPAGSRVRITIRDSGVGIPPDQLDRVFEEFTQVDTGLSRSHEGTGLGLPLSRRLTELIGGSLELRSELGVGTTVTLLLPTPGPHAVRPRSASEQPLKRD